MAFGDISVLGALRNAMSWRQTRQRVIAENIANSDTVGFRARDLKPLDPTRMAGPVGGLAPVSAMVTNAHHIAAMATSTSASKVDTVVDGFETTPDGNGVRLEDQMMKLTDNQMDYEVATTLYQRSLGLIRTAIRRG